MLELLPKTICGVVLLVLALELPVVSYVVSETRASMAVPNGLQPSDILRGASTEDGVTTLLAVGDIADCQESSGLAAELPNTMKFLGFPNAQNPALARANETAALAKTLPDVPIIALGDTVYRRGRPDEFTGCFEPVWGALKDRILASPGNHEYGTFGAFGYYDYFGPQAGPDRKGWYTANVPGWTILSLNSEVDASPSSAQGRWLQEQLDRSQDACVLAFYHKPAYSLEARKDLENAQALFQHLNQAGTSLVLNGHNHFYERTSPLDGDGRVDPALGTVGFTVGTGGRKGGSYPPIAATQASVFGRTGMLRLDLKAGAYDWAFIDAVTGDVMDAGTHSCNPARRGA